MTSLDKACQIAGAVNSNVIRTLIELDNKITSLRRIVGILRGSADLLLVPLLPPLSQIDLQTYEALRRACPFLQLPSLPHLPGLAQLSSLINTVTAAYNNFLDKLEKSALAVIDQLQRQLDRAIGAILKKVAPLMGLVDCICQGAATIEDRIEAEKAKQIFADINSSNKPTLLDQQLVLQVNQFNAARDNVKLALSL